MHLFQSNDTRTITCEFCGKEFSQVCAMKDHLASSCPEKTVPCDQAENGCAWKGRRLSLEAHTDNCPYESIKGFFSIHNIKMAQFSRDNERLRRRTDELEGIIRILRQELEWTKIALGPWYRPVYPERPPITANYNQCQNVEGAGAGPGPNRVRPILLEGMSPTAGDTAHPESGVENGSTETLGSFDPHSFINRTQNEVSNLRATNDALTAPTVTDTESNPNISARTSNNPVEFRDNHGLGGNPIPGPGSFNGLESIQSIIGSELSPETRNLQSAATMQPTAPFSDYFPVENRVGFEDGPSSQLLGWQHTLPPDSMPSNPSPGIYSPVSISVRISELEFSCNPLITRTNQMGLPMNRTNRRYLDPFMAIWLRRLPFHGIDPSLRQASTNTLLHRLTSALRLKDLWWVYASLLSLCQKPWNHKEEDWISRLRRKGFGSARKWVH